MRTYIKDLKDSVGKEISISGWVSVVRDQGKMVFFDFRDMTGTVQGVALSNKKELVELAKTIKNEWVVEVVGVVNKRPEKMVNEKVLIKDKYRQLKKFLFISGIFLVIIIILAGVYFFGWFSGSGDKIILENPLKNIVFENTNSEGLVNYDAVVSRGVMEFNADYINYILAALGVGKLHKSMMGYGNPVIEMNLNDEVWQSLSLSPHL